MVFGVTNLSGLKKRPGDLIKADEYNRLAAAFEELSRKAAQQRQPPTNVTFLNYVEQTLDPNETDSRGRQVNYDATQLPSGDPWQHSGSSWTQGSIAESRNTAWNIGFDPGRRDFFHHYRPRNFMLNIGEPGYMLGSVSETGGIAIGSTGDVRVYMQRGNGTIDPAGLSTFVVTAINWTIPNLVTDIDVIMAWHPQSRQFVIVDAYAGWRVRGATTAAVATTDATFTLQSITVFDGAIEGTSLTIQNTMGFEADSGAVAVCVYNDTDSQWECLQITPTLCPEC